MAMTVNKWPKMTALARTFPCFAVGGVKQNQPGIEPFDALLLEKHSGGLSSGEMHAAHFLLSVFDPNWGRTDDMGRATLRPHIFNMHDALGAWDHEYRAAFIAWANAPWWA